LIVIFEGLDLLSKLLTIDPEKRITATQALNHPYFTPIPLGMSKNPTSKTFYAEALSKYSKYNFLFVFLIYLFRNESSPTSRSPTKTNAASPIHYSLLTASSPDKGSPLMSNNQRYAEKDSLYLDMGRPELNGKIDTLTSNSTNNSILLFNRIDSNSNVGSTPNLISAFAKAGVDTKGRSRSFKGHNGAGSNQSFLKAAIFRNMQKNNEIVGDESLDARRGSIENHFGGDPQAERRLSAFLSPRNSDDVRNQRHFSVGPDDRHESKINDASRTRFTTDDGGEEGMNGNSSRVSFLQQKRYQPFAKH